MATKKSKDFETEVKEEEPKKGREPTKEVKYKSKGGENKREVELEKIKVLSWNICGGNVEKKNGTSESSKGDVKTERETIEVRSSGPTPSARHAIVSKVVEMIDPDILLLQETKTNILVEEIEKLDGPKKRKYKQVAPIRQEGAREDSFKEAKVLYDSNKFEAKLRKNELHCALETIPEAKTDVSLRERKDGQPREAGVGKVIKERVSWVCLRRKDGPNAGREIIFMSFHNYYTKGSDKSARVFCKAVAEMKSRTGVDVVAGADFNCEFDKDKVGEENEDKAWKEKIYIPKYTMSTRRRSKIDYIITTLKTPDEVRVEAREPWDIAASRLEGRVVVDKNGDKYSFSPDDYHKTVDHDPLICTLTL